MDVGKILFVLTNHGRLGDADDPRAEKTGFHLTEAAHAWQVLTEAGFTIELASPAGGAAPMDPSSADHADPAARAFLEDTQVRARLADTRALATLAPEDYAALYFPGGHGTMWDLPDSRAVQHAVRVMFDQGKPVAAVCHGPAALVNVKQADGNWLVAGKKVSVFTDEEEIATGKQQLMPFSLASRFVEHGAVHNKAANFDALISIHGTLVTGQNPASARGVGIAIRDLLQGKPCSPLRQALPAKTRGGAER